MGKNTPLYDIHRSLGAKMVEYAGWNMPSEYSSLVEEHRGVREGCGLFDVSHMGEILLEGEEALSFTERMVTNDIAGLENRHCRYTLLLNEEGGILEDLLIYKYSDDKLLWVVNAANTEKVLKWLEDHQGDAKVRIQDVSESWGLIAVQGPKAGAVLKAGTDFPLEEMGYYTFEPKVTIHGVECMISRTGYTGEDGYEIYVPAEETARIFEALLNTEGAIPCGLGARDTLRFEAGMPLYGNEMDESVFPQEAGLMFAVKMHKDFVGKEALEEAAVRGAFRKLVGLELMGKGIPRQGYVVKKDDREIGYVTTGYLSPTLQKSIANVRIEGDEAALGNMVQVQIRKKTVDGKIISRKFLK